MSLAQWRAHHARLGFATIPLRPRSKRPLRRGWLVPNEAQWQGAPPDANLGILTGAASSGLVVLDFDTRDGPERVLGMTAEQLAVVTIVVETSRGWHVYAREPGRATGTLCESVDVRGEGGMVVAPPSIHPTGFEYRLLGGAETVVELSSLLPERAEPEAAPDLREVDAWVALQAPKLQEAWRRLKEPPSASFDVSKADFAVARCLWEWGWPPERVADLLLRLPGSRARERGEAYARRTAERAAAAPPRRLS